MPGPSPRPRRRRRAATHGVVAALVLLAVAAPSGRAGAAGESGAAGDASGRAESAVRYRPPVAAPVIDAFREPAGPYGPGNRGLEYATTTGAPVLAIGAGRVAFAGQVAGRLAVTVRHPDGLRSSVTGLAEVLVEAGDLVALGAPLGRSGPRTHLGVRDGARYLDPAALFGRRRRAVLVPSAAIAPGRRQGPCPAQVQAAPDPLGVHSSRCRGGATITGRPEPGRPPPTRTNVRPGTPSVAAHHLVARSVVPGSRRTEGKEPS